MASGVRGVLCLRFLPLNRIGSRRTEMGGNRVKRRESLSPSDNGSRHPSEPLPIHSPILSIQRLCAPRLDRATRPA